MSTPDDSTSSFLGLKVSVTPTKIILFIIIIIVVIGGALAIYYLVINDGELNVESAELPPACEWSTQPCTS
jgi:hypothetical protein